MNPWVNTVLTDKGTALLAKLTQGNTLHITRAATGEGFVTPGMLTKQTAITGHKQDLEFKTVTYPENGKCAIPVSLKNDALVAGYKVTQVGLYATDPDDGEILLIISQAPDANSGTIVPSATEMPGYSAEWTFYLQYGQADGVNVTVSPSNTVTREDMENYVDEAIKDKANEKHSHDASDIESGTLSSDRLPVVPIPKGGTGATSAEKARANLGITPENIGAATPKNVSDHNTSPDAHQDIRELIGSKAPASHTQDASTITAGTLAGAVKANAAAAEVVSYAQVRDISAGTGDMEAGKTPLATGSLYFVYE